jgi:hypothetical protein
VLARIGEVSTDFEPLVVVKSISRDNEVEHAVARDFLFQGSGIPLQFSKEIAYGRQITRVDAYLALEFHLGCLLSQRNTLSIFRTIRSAHCTAAATVDSVLGRGTRESHYSVWQFLVRFLSKIHGK